MYLWSNTSALINVREGYAPHTFSLSLYFLFFSIVHLYILSLDCFLHPAWNSPLPSSSSAYANRKCRSVVFILFMLSTGTCTTNNTVPIIPQSTFTDDIYIYSLHNWMYSFICLAHQAANHIWCYTLTLKSFHLLVHLISTRILMHVIHNLKTFTHENRLDRNTFRFLALFHFIVQV